MAMFEMQLQSPFPDDVAFIFLGPDEQKNAKLHVEEQALLSEKALEKRVLEFTLGRWAARLALRKIGLECPPPILRGNDREPRWPDGIVGSITHCRGHAAVAVCRTKTARGLGVDLEYVERKSEIDITDKIASPEEAAWIHELPDDSSTRLMMLFSAKEALFKALYPEYKQYFWHHQAQLKWSKEDQSFIATLNFAAAQDLPPGRPFAVRVQQHKNFIFSSMILEV